MMVVIGNINLLGIHTSFVLFTRVHLKHNHIHNHPPCMFWKKHSFQKSIPPTFTCLQFWVFTTYNLPITANYSPPLVALINTEINRNGVVLPWSNWWYDGPQPMRWRDLGWWWRGLNPEDSEGWVHLDAHLNMGKICVGRFVNLIYYWEAVNMSLYFICYCFT